MNKSLLERIGKNTRTVIAEREAEARAKNKLVVLEYITEETKKRASNGKSIFCIEGENELVFDLVFDEMSTKAVEIALKDIGLEFHRYPMRNVAAIPQVNVSNEIQELLKTYYEVLTDFENTEKAKAKADCLEVLKKLEKGEYEVDDIDKVTVSFTSTSSSEQYTNHTREMMKAQGFDVDFYSDAWTISIIQKRGD